MAARSPQPSGRMAPARGPVRGRDVRERGNRCLPLFRSEALRTCCRSLASPAERSTTAGSPWSAAGWAASPGSSAPSSTTSSTPAPRTATRSRPGSPAAGQTRCASEPRLYGAATFTPTGGRPTTTTWRARSRRRSRCACASPIGSAAADRRRLRMIEALPHSPTAQARLASRWLVRAPRGRPGIEGALVRAVLWKRLVSPRNALARRRQTRSRAHGGGTGRTPRTVRGPAQVRDHGDAERRGGGLRRLLHRPRARRRA